MIIIQELILLIFGRPLQNSTLSYRSVPLYEGLYLGYHNKSVLLQPAKKIYLHNQGEILMRHLCN